MDIKIISFPDGIEDDGVKGGQQGEWDQVDEYQVHPVDVYLAKEWMNARIKGWMDEWMDEWMNENR